MASMPTAYEVLDEPSPSNCATGLLTDPGGRSANLQKPRHAVPVLVTNDVGKRAVVPAIKLRAFVPLAALLLIAPPAIPSQGSDTVEFKDASLIVEINATDGDAGLQIDLDHEPWQSLTIAGPDGKKLLDLRNRGDLAGFGLTELFAESSEPPFTELPLDDFKQLWPEGTYRFTGRTIDGVRLRSDVEFVHAFPVEPIIIFPEDDGLVSAARLLIVWEGTPQPPGVEVTEYQVTLSNEDTGMTLDVEVPASVTEIAVPETFVVPGEHKVEVGSIDATGSRTFQEVSFEMVDG